MQIRSLNSREESARYALGQLEDQLQPLTFTNFSIKRTLNPTTSQITHTIIANNTGPLNVTIIPRDVSTARKAKYSVTVTHLNDSLITLTDLPANTVKTFSFDAEEWEVYTLTTSSTTGPVEYEISTSTQIGDQAVVEYYFQIMDKFINFGLLDETEIKICENVIATYGENTTVQPYLSVPSLGYTAEELNKYDRKILAWTNYWNDRAYDYMQRRLQANANRDFICLDPNLAKAIMFQESNIGYIIGNGTGYSDPMQALNRNDLGIKTMARINGNTVGDWGIPQSGIPLASLYLNNRIGQNPNTSVALGVRWLLWKHNISNGDIWESAKNYNGKQSVQANGKKFCENYATSVEGLYTSGIYKRFDPAIDDWGREYILFNLSN